VDQLIMACFVLGMSTRKVSTALFSFLGERVSASTVSEVAKRFGACGDGGIMSGSWGRVSILFFDGVVLKQKGARRFRKRSFFVFMG